MKRTIIISVILIAGTISFAAEPTAYVDNFVYTLDYAHHTAEVAANPKASGDIIIPEQIKDGEGKTYTVTSLSAEAFRRQNIYRYLTERRSIQGMQRGDIDRSATHNQTTIPFIARRNRSICQSRTMERWSIIYRRLPDSR